MTLGSWLLLSFFWGSGSSPLLAFGVAGHAHPLIATRKAIPMGCYPTCVASALFSRHL